MKNVLIALLVLSAAHVSHAADNSEKLAEITAMEAEISQMQSNLDELDSALQKRTEDKGIAYLVLGKNVGMSLLTGFGAGYFVKLHVDGAGPFVAATEWVETWDPSTGALFGWAPKMAAKDVVLAGVQLAEIGTIVGGTFYAAFRAYQAVGNAVTISIDAIAAADLTLDIQVGQEKLRLAKRYLRAVKATLE